MTMKVRFGFWNLALWCSLTQCGLFLFFGAFPLQLWDVNMESHPVASFNVHEQLRARVCLFFHFFLFLSLKILLLFPFLQLSAL